VVKRLFCLFLTCLIGVTSVPATVYAQQPPGPITYNQQELDQLLAPIALYPDPLLSQVLMAATYPLLVVQAERFVRKNPSLKGDSLARAVDSEPWDPSVKALVQFPAVLRMMDDQLAWTQKLGDAFLAQQDAVMDTVQSLRAKAQAAGTLRSNRQQRVVVQDGAIDIEPYAPDVIYVPYYNPNVVYGGWWWPDRPPMVWVPPLKYRSPSFGNAIEAGIAFGFGVAIIDSIFIDARPDWHRHHFIINNGPAGNRSRGGGVIWTHNPANRYGVPYRDAQTRDRFQPRSNNIVNRDAFRGHVTGAAPAPLPVTGAARSSTQNRPAAARAQLPTHQGAVAQPRIAQPVQPHTETARPATPPHQEVRPAMHQPVAQIHPLMPAGPAAVIQSHAERGRASREGSSFNPGRMNAGPSNHSDNRSAPQRGGAGHEQQHKPSR
jgi:hypothetical protein